MDDWIRGEGELVALKEKLATEARAVSAMEIGGAFFAPYILAAAEAKSREARQAQVDQDAQLGGMIERPSQLMKQMRRLHSKYGLRPTVAGENVENGVPNVVEVESVPIQDELMKIHFEHVQVKDVPTVGLRGGSMGEEYDMDDFLEDDETAKFEYPRKDSAICMDFDVFL